MAGKVQLCDQGDNKGKGLDLGLVLQVPDLLKHQCFTKNVTVFTSGIELPEGHFSYVASYKLS